MAPNISEGEFLNILKKEPEKTKKEPSGNIIKEMVPY